MTRTSWLSLLSCVALTLAFTGAGCGGGGSSKPKDAGGSGGSNSDAPAGGDTAGTGGTAGTGADGSSGDVPVGADGSRPDGAVGGSGGGTGGASGGTDGGTGGRDTAAERPGTGGSGGAPADGGADAVVLPRCQAGEACTGDYRCNATRCIRMEQEVCHCVSGSLFCGPVDCDVPDGGTDAGRPDASPPRDGGLVPMCPMDLQPGDDCVQGTDRFCNTECTNGRTRTCVCNARDVWVCTPPSRC